MLDAILINALSQGKRQAIGKLKSLYAESPSMEIVCQLIIESWNSDAAKRPSTVEIFKKLLAFLKKKMLGRV